MSEQLKTQLERLVTEYGRRFWEIVFGFIGDGLCECGRLPSHLDKWAVCDRCRTYWPADGLVEPEGAPVLGSYRRTEPFLPIVSIRA